MSMTTIDQSAPGHASPIQAAARNGTAANLRGSALLPKHLKRFLVQSRVTSDPASAPGARLSWLAPYAAGLLSLVIYFVTLAPTVTAEDSGELISAAYYFGVPHPPGYPLWTMLCGTFLRLFPLSCVAWRGALFSAICTSVGAGVFCRTLSWMGLSAPFAFAGALICGCGRVLWSQSVIVEVYTLHFLIFTLMLWCAVRWRLDRRGRWLVGACLLLGLGMSDHQTIGFSGVALAAWAILQCPRLLRQRRLVLGSTLAFVIGLMPHVYMYVRAQADPPINWGEPKTLRALWDHVSRHQYKSSGAPSVGYIQSLSLAKMKGQLALITGYCLGEFTPALMVIAGIGIAAMALSRYRSFLLLWFLLVACNVGIFMAMQGFGYRTRQDQWTNQVFFLPVYASFAMAIAFGLSALWTMTGLVARVCPWGLSYAVRLAAAAVVLGAAATPAIANYRANDMHRYWYAYDHGKNILDTVLPNAIIFPSGDHNTFPLLYLTLVEKYRPDVIVADKYGYIDLSLYQDMPDNSGKPRTHADRDRIEEWVIRHARRPVYYTVKKASLVPNAQQVAVGILYHLLPEGKALDTDNVWARYHYRNLDGASAPRDFGADNILTDWEYFQGLHQLELGHVAAAMTHFATCEQYGRGIKEVINNIGSALAEHGRIDDAISYYHKAATMDLDYEAPRWNLARTYKTRGQFAEAERMFTELTKANPNDFRTWGELGFLVDRLEPGSSRAVECWNRSLSLNPGQPQIIEQMYLRYHKGVGATQPSATTWPATDTAPSGTTQPKEPSHAPQPAGHLHEGGAHRAKAPGDVSTRAPIAEHLATRAVEAKR
jgi:tetratricopeptide (TPR) repeat protein